MTDEKKVAAAVLEAAIELNKIATDTLSKLQQIKELQLSGPHAEQVFSDVKDGVIVINEENEIVITNAKADDMFGYGRGELLSKPLQILIPEKYRAAHHAKQASYFANPAPRKFRDLEGLRKDGTMFPIEIALQPLGQISEKPLVMAILRKIEASSTNTVAPATIWLG